MNKKKKIQMFRYIIKISRHNNNYQIIEFDV